VAVDEGSGVAGYHVYWGPDENGTADTLTVEPSYSPALPDTSGGAAAYYLRAAPLDNAGNLGEWQTVGVWRYDTIAPAGSIQIAGGATVPTLPVMLNPVAADEHSGVADMRFSVDGQNWTEWEPYIATRGWQLADVDEPQTIYAQFRDAAGNLSAPASAIVTADLTLAPPSSTNYTIARSVMGMGGGVKTSAGYYLLGTSGQPYQTGGMQSNSYQVASGFWAQTTTAANTPTPTPSPTNTPTLIPTNTPTLTPSFTPTPTATSSPTNTPTSTPATDLIFKDDFESGNLSTWSSSVTDAGDLSVSTAAALVGSYGLKAVIDSNGAIYVQDNTPVSEPRYRARFYLDPNSIPMASGNAHNILVGYSGGITPFIMQFRYSSGSYQLQAKILNDSTGYVSTNWYTISDAPHFVEIDWKASSAAGANNGYISLWIDGILKQTKSGVDNDTRRIEEVRLGPSAGIDTGTRGTYYLDAFESRKLTYIGPASPQTPTSTPTLTVTPGITPSFTPTPTPTQTPIGNTPTSTSTPTATLTPTVSPTPTPTVTSSDLIFADGFESGNLSAWSSSVTDAGDLSVNTAAALSGSYGLSVVVDSNDGIYIQDSTPVSESRYRPRFYFDPNTISMVHGDTHTILVGYSGSTTPFIVQFRRNQGSYQIRAQMLNDSTSYLNTAWYTISDAAHFIEIDWKASSAAGANNGYISLWIDGILKETKSGIDNDTRRIDEIRLGPSAGVNSGTRGTYYFDAFESRKTTYIGP
jgi:hypothetical protein